MASTKRRFYWVHYWEYTNLGWIPRALPVNVHPIKFMIDEQGDKFGTVRVTRLASWQEITESQYKQAVRDGLL